MVLKNNLSGEVACRGVSPIQKEMLVIAGGASQ